jgi:chromosome segregation ATPase
MAYLQNEKARLQSDIQAIGVEITALTAQQQVQQQAIGAAQALVSSATTGVTEAQAQVPPLETAAAAADRRVEALNEQIEAHQANEPDATIEVPPRPPRPNPAWITWKRALDRLAQQLAGAETEAGRAQTQFNEATTRVSRAVADLQAAERQVAAATEAVRLTQLSIAAAQQREQAAQAQVADVDRWNQEIARDPLNRINLETAAVEVSGRSAVLEDEHAVIAVQNEIANETLASLTARRDRLGPALAEVNAQLAVAAEQLRVARLAFTAATRRIQTHRQRGPR